jgi:hypothetical protein
MNVVDFQYLMMMLKVFYKEYSIKYVYLFDNNALIQEERCIYDQDRLNFRKYIRPKRFNELICKSE